MGAKDLPELDKRILLGIYTNDVKKIEEVLEFQNVPEFRSMSEVHDLGESEIAPQDVVLR